MKQPRQLNEHNLTTVLLHIHQSCPGGGSRRCLALWHAPADDTHHPNPPAMSKLTRQPGMCCESSVAIEGIPGLQLPDLD